MLDCRLRIEERHRAQGSSLREPARRARREVGRDEKRHVAEGWRRAALQLSFASIGFAVIGSLRFAVIG